ncbi:MAG: hypothetical protein ACFFCT_14905, partial [Candidatus Odinarchaeota archaeon]
LELQAIDTMFRYVNNSQDGVTTNWYEFFFSFDNIESGSAFLRLRTVTLTIWIRDVTCNQTNTALIGVDDLTTKITFNPGRDVNEITVQSANVTENNWWTTGICRVDYLSNELIPDMAAAIEYAFSVNSGIAEAHHGHRFHVKIQVDVTYHAFYLGGVFYTHYQDRTYNWTLGEDYPIYMLPYGSP